MRRLILIGGFAVVVLAVAGCGGTESLPTEGALRQRAEAASEAASVGFYRDVYRFMAPEFRKKCDRDIFEVDAFSNLVFMRAHHLGMQIASNPEIDYIHDLGFQVANVTVNGTEGRVELKVSHKGEPAGLVRVYEPDRWVFKNGKWWIKSSRYWMNDRARRTGGCEIGWAFPE